LSDTFSLRAEPEGPSSQRRRFDEDRQRWPRHESRRRAASAV